MTGALRWMVRQERVAAESFGQRARLMWAVTAYMGRYPDGRFVIVVAGPTFHRTRSAAIAAARAAMHRHYRRER